MIWWSKPILSIRFVSFYVVYTYRSFTLDDEQYIVGDFVLIANDENGNENLESKDTAFTAQIKDVIEKGRNMKVMY